MKNIGFLSSYANLREESSISTKSCNVLSGRAITVWNMEVFVAKNNLAG